MLMLTWEVEKCKPLVVGNFDIDSDGEVGCCKSKRVAAPNIAPFSSVIPHTICMLPFYPTLRLAALPYHPNTMLAV